MLDESDESSFPVAYSARLLRRALSHVLPYRNWIACTLVLSLVASGVGTFEPLLYKRICDMAVGGRATPPEMAQGGLLRALFPPLSCS